MTPWLQDSDLTLYVGDALEVLRGLPDGSVDCCVTSPPYWGLRDYGTGEWEGGDEGCDHDARQRTRNAGSQPGTGNAGVVLRDGIPPSTCACGARRVDRQIGLEATPDLFVAAMVAVFREVRRVLAPHGTCWVNLGSSYMSSPSKGGSGPGGKNEARWSYGRASRGSGPSQSHQPQRDPAYDSGGTEPQDSPGPGSACLDLCGECLDDFQTRHGRSEHNVQPLARSQPLAEPTDPRNAPADSEGATPLLDAQASTTPESSAPPPALCWRCGTRPASVSLSVLPTTSPDAQASAHTTAYNDGTTQPSSTSADHSQDTLSWVRAWWEHYTSTLKPKDLIPIPWMVAMAMQMDGWYLRCDVIWGKSNPMPESVTDRPTKAHEYILQMSKQPRYWFDAEAVREQNADPEWTRNALENPGWLRRSDSKADASRQDGERMANGRPHTFATQTGRNVRSVWHMATQPYPEAHFATFPEELPRRAIAAGCPLAVCRVCGKPWIRTTEVQRDEREFGREQQVGASSARRHDGSRLTSGTGHRTINGTTPSFRPPVVTSTGWEPSCDCAEKAAGQETVPVRGLPGAASGGEGERTGDLRDVSPGSRLTRPGLVLDPFAGAGTTLLVARKLGRSSIGIELNPEYAELIARRTRQLSLLAETV